MSGYIWSITKQYHFTKTERILLWLVIYILLISFIWQMLKVSYTPFLMISNKNVQGDGKN